MPATSNKEEINMKKIPTLFTRIFDGNKIVGITPEITPGCEEAFRNGLATVKVDGSCCMIMRSMLYKRYDAKKGKTPPPGAIPCQPEPDPVTGHWPHWIACDPDSKADKWYIEAFQNYCAWKGYHNITDGTYEAIGPHFQGNPYGCKYDYLYKHGGELVTCERTFEGVREWLTQHEEEGLVFWLNGEPVCKIKRTDFGLDWPMEEVTQNGKN